MEPKTPRPADVIPISPHVARLRAAAALKPALVESPRDGRATGKTVAFYSASIALLSSEDPESAVRKFTVGSGHKGKFLDIGLHQRDGDSIVRGTRQIMLVAIDPGDGVALLLDWNGNRITLAEGGESVPIGSGRYRLHLERIERSGEDFTSFRQPGRSEAEMAFMDKHAGREWKRKFKELE